MRVNSLSDALGVEILGKAEVRTNHTLIRALMTKGSTVLEPRWKRQGSGRLAQ